jgi:SAM-dependent methyltransferase
VYDAPQHLTQKFDVVFASYGTIGWLPDINQWAQVVSHFLKPGGKLVFVEFHPFVWIFNNDFSEITYHYHNHSPIVETTTGSYAAPKNPAKTTQITHNHSLSEVINALINNGLTINIFEEYNYSPYNCFEGTQQIAEGKYVIQKFGDKIPMVYAIVAQKNA